MAIPYVKVKKLLQFKKSNPRKIYYKGTNMLFRPHFEPARTFYDALMDESQHRKKRDCDEWILAERERMWREARDYSQKNGLPVLKISDIERAERQACGHVDYVSKFAHGIVAALRLADLRLAAGELQS